MEVVFTGRYKINLLFSVLISLTAAAFASYVSSFFLKDFLPGIDNIEGITAAVVFVFLHLSITSRYRKRKKTAAVPFPEEWRSILEDLVLFYRMLDEDEKYFFEKKVQIFLSEKKITGVETDIDDSTRLLIASAAIIPVFKIEDWEYDTLVEILVYPDRFNHDYNFTSDSGKRDVLGMVVQHSSSLIISKKELFRGFTSMADGNTAIHEFIHKIDEEDGEIDGLPVLMLNKSGIAEWKKIRSLEMEKLEAGKSDLDPYALTGAAEFLAVAGEYFFEHPLKMMENNPDLYRILKTIFKQDMASLIKSEAMGLIGIRKK